MYLVQFHHVSWEPSEKENASARIRDKLEADEAELPKGRISNNNFHWDQRETSHENRSEKFHKHRGKTCRRHGWGGVEWRDVHKNERELLEKNKNVDVVFLLDCTRNMTGYINQFKNEIKQIVGSELLWWYPGGVRYRAPSGADKGSISWHVTF